MTASRVNRFLAPSHHRRTRGWTAASTVFQVFDMTRTGIEPNLLALVARAQPTVSRSRLFRAWIIKHDISPG